jgi:hypothetical protein
MMILVFGGGDGDGDGRWLHGGLGSEVIEEWVGMGDEIETEHREVVVRNGGEVVLNWV